MRFELLLLFAFANLFSFSAFLLPPPPFSSMFAPISHHGIQLVSSSRMMMMNKSAMIDMKVLHQQGRNNSSSSSSSPSMVENVGRLRKDTGVSMSRCKEALMATGNNYSAAVEWLDKNNLLQAEAKANKVGARTAAEGLVAVARSHDLTLAALIELNCETDFVSRNQLFADLAAVIPQTVISAASTNGIVPSNNSASAIIDLDLAHVKDLKIDGTSTVQAKIVSAIGTLGENIVLRRVSLAKATPSSGFIGVATHSGSTPSLGRMAAMLHIDTKASAEAADPIVSKIAKHVIGMNPSSIAELLQQQFLFDPSVKIEQLLERESKRLGSELRIAQMIRFACGENIERKQTNFAEEVNQMLKK